MFSLSPFHWCTTTTTTTTVHLLCVMDHHNYICHTAASCHLLSAVDFCWRLSLAFSLARSLFGLNWTTTFFYDINTQTTYAHCSLQTPLVLLINRRSCLPTHTHTHSHWLDAKHACLNWTNTTTTTSTKTTTAMTSVYSLSPFLSSSRLSINALSFLLFLLKLNIHSASQRSSASPSASLWAPSSYVSWLAGCSTRDQLLFGSWLT